MNLPPCDGFFLYTFITHVHIKDVYCDYEEEEERRKKQTEGKNYIKHI